MESFTTTSIIENLSNDIQDLIDIDDGNQSEALNALIDIYKVRHDSIHRSIAAALGALHLMQEKPISSFIYLEDQSMCRLTPDMFIMISDTGRIVQNMELASRLIICDVSVSSRSNLEKDKKVGKYGRLCNQIEEKCDKRCDVFVFNVDSRLTNLEVKITEFEKFTGFNLSELDIIALRIFFSKVETSIIMVKNMISDDSLVRKYFEQEFGDGTSQEQALPIDFSLRINEMMKKSLKEKKRNTVLNEHITEILSSLRSSDIEMNKDIEDAHKIARFETVCGKLKDIIEDDDIIRTFSEQETTSEKVQNALSRIEIENSKFNCTKTKPTHHMYTPILSDQKHSILQNLTPVDKSILSGLRLEQQQIIKILSLFKHNTDTNEPILFVSEMWNIFEKLLTDDKQDFSLPMFNYGIYKDKETEAIFRKEYEDYKYDSKRTHSKTRSYLEFLREKKKMNVPADNESRFFKQKMIRVNMEEQNEQFISFWKRSHSGYVKEKMYTEKPKSSCQFDQVKDVDTLIDMLSEPLTGQIEKDIYDDFYTTWESVDDNTLKSLKNRMINESRPILKEIRHTKGYPYLQKQSLVAEQLMHFQQLTLPTNSFTFFTCGMPNVLYIMNNSYHDKGKDVGKAFLICGYTDDERWLNRCFGRICYKEVHGFSGTNKIFLFATDWRRLETFKCTFLKDQYFSILSTSMNGLLRHKELVVRDETRATRIYSNEVIKHHFTLKIVIGLCSNQKVAEMLADMRYAIMGSFSEFSEIEQLCLDKFSPPYNNSLEVWIASRISNLIKLISDFVENGVQNIFFKQPVFHGKKRADDSIGGKFEMPSIWDGTIITDLQDLLDDMFMYVHTLKEPSSIHHENIKAVNTIMEYQNKYMSMSKERKMGKLRTFDELKSMLIDPVNNIGHSSEITTISSDRTMSTLTGTDWKTKFNGIFNEPIANITSTKAAIPEYDRELVDSESKLSTKNKKKIKISQSLFVQEYSRFRKTETQEYIPKLLKTNISKESSLPNKNRSKVHDCLLDVIEQNNYIKTVFDMAEWNVLKNNSKTLADICIKAQYGAKREFYVINVGSKANARVLENMFNEICKMLPNEMISIPGDKKMIYMQDFLNQALSKKHSDERIFFVNGDCTKWSAAETMECFASLVNGMKSHLDEDYIKYMLMVINMWGNKEITIPVSLFQNTFFTTNEKTKYLKSHSAVIDSDQNFLQGMFNYMSSFKAVCCSNMTRDVWKQIYPDSKLKVEHMEHSDDYSMIITVKDIQELKRFRILHRVLMKCHGFNDSKKKTNTQQFLMEFISLVSFNGHMTYPHIKKLKECGMNLGCTGYRDDIDSVISRVGETVRVGSLMTSSYFMQRVHLANVARSYSILPGQLNNFADINTLINVPVEIFGIPDVHPLLSFLCKGMTNNYRLLKFAPDDLTAQMIINDKAFSVNIKEELSELLRLEKTESLLNATLLNEDFTEGLRLYHPTYNFDVENNLIKKIRSKVKISFEDACLFWESHKTYNFIKPNDQSLLVNWMRSMYFKQNFSLAYSRNSRSQITLRLSTFTTKPCLITSKNRNIISEPLTIKNYVSRFLMRSLDNQRSDEYFSQTITHNDIEKASMNNDSTVSIIYSFFEQSVFVDGGKHTLSTVAALSPPKINWLTIDNDASPLIQFMFNYEDFKKDLRRNKGLTSLQSDKKKMEEYYKVNLDENTPLNTIKSVFSDIILSKPNRNLCMTYKSQDSGMEDFIKHHIEYGTIYQRKLHISTAGITQAKNPHNMDVYFKKMRTYAKNPFRALIDDTCLAYTMLRHCYNIPLNEIKILLLDMRIKDLPYEEEGDELTNKILFNNFDIGSLKSMGFTLNELKSFAYLKAFLKDDTQILIDLSNENMIYTYQYIDVPMELRWVFKECVLFKYRGFDFKAFRHTKFESFLIVSETLSKKYLADSYLITLKLFNKIKLSDFEKRISQTTLKDTMKSSKGRTLPYFTKDKSLLDVWNILGVKKIHVFDNIINKGSFQPISELNIETNDVLFVQANVSENITAGFNERFNLSININWDQNSVFLGNKKIFTLPVLTCTQSNITEVKLEFNLNGTSLNWWLQSSRVQKLIHNEEISISKADFNEFGKFLLTDKKNIIFIRSRRLISDLKHFPSLVETPINDDDFDKLDKRIKKMSYNTETLPPNRNTQLNNEQNHGLIDIVPKDDDDDDEIDLDELEQDDQGQLPADFMKNMMSNMKIDLDFHKFESIAVESDSDDENGLDAEFLKVDSSNGSSKSSDSQDKEEYMTNEQFKKMVPKTSTSEISFMKGESHSVSGLKKIGDPTREIIERSFVSRDLIRSYGINDKLALLYRLKQIFILCDYISDLELVECMTIVSKIMDSLEMKDEWKISNDTVLKRNNDFDFDIFAKYEDNFSNDIRNQIYNQGGLSDTIDGRTWIYIPLPESRKKVLLEQLSLNMKITSYMPMQVLDNCYSRLFEQPFRRTGYVLQLLEELQSQA